MTISHCPVLYIRLGKFHGFISNISLLIINVFFLLQTEIASSLSVTVLWFIVTQDGVIWGEILIFRIEKVTWIQAWEVRRWGYHMSFRFLFFLVNVSCRFSLWRIYWFKFYECWYDSNVTSDSSYDENVTYMGFLQFFLSILAFTGLTLRDSSLIDSLPSLLYFS